MSPATYEAVQCTLNTQTTVQVGPIGTVLLAPILAAAGFYPAAPLPVPANSGVPTWSRLANVTGLVAGSTQLGDELSMLFHADQIVNSVFAPMLSWTWNGTTFAP